MRSILKSGIRIATAMILIGIFMMCQPFTFWLYPKGFALLGIGTLMYIIISHFKVEQNGESSSKGTD